MPLRNSFILLVVVVLAICISHVDAAEMETRPNFLLIVADDLCWRDIGFVGNQDVSTPNLDKLRAEGMWLKGMYTPATTCSPSRHALYTGLYPVRSGAYPNHTRVFTGTKSIFTHLKANGYRVGLQGKGHVNPVESFPFELLKNDEADNFKNTQEFISRKEDKPWFLVFGSNDPHTPWSRGPQGRFDPNTIEVPPYLHDNFKTRELLTNYYAEISALDTQVGSLLSLLKDARQDQNTLVIFVSEQGSSFPYGGKWSVYDNGIRTTSIIRWPGKVTPGSSSNALIQYVDIPVTLLEAAGIDSTLCDPNCPDGLGNKGFNGKSFIDVITGKSTTFRDYIYSQHTTVGIVGYKDPYPMRAVRDTRYKYIRNLAPENTYSITGIHKDEPFKSWVMDAESDSVLKKRVELLSHRPAEELYDLQSDEYEMVNLANNPKLADVQARLSNELDRWMIQQGDKGMETELKAKARQGGKAKDGE